MTALKPVPFDDALRAIRARHDNLLGIPVFLALEDVDTPAGPPPAADAFARLAHGYLAEQLAGRAEATLDDLAVVSRLLGAHHFDAPA
jgi:hypothetical protein